MAPSNWELTSFQHFFSYKMGSRPTSETDEENQCRTSKIYVSGAIPFQMLIMLISFAQIDNAPVNLCTPCKLTISSFCDLLAFGPSGTSILFSMTRTNWKNFQSKNMAEILSRVCPSKIKFSNSIVLGQFYLEFWFLPSPANSKYLFFLFPIP